MHPLLVLLAFTVAALVTYAVVLGLLTAASVVRNDRDAEPAPEPASRREHAGH
jgi:hypothetical protein